MNYLGLYASINPLISQLVSSLTPSSPSSSSSSSPRPSSNSLYMIRTVSTQKLPPKSSLHMLKVGLRERGHVYLQAINELANALCKRVESRAAKVVTCEGFRPEYSSVTKPVRSAGLKIITTCFTSGQ